MDKNIVFRFKVVHHGREDSPDKGTVEEALANPLVIVLQSHRLGVGQLQNRVHRAVGDVVRKQIAAQVPFVQQLEGQIL